MTNLIQYAQSKLLEPTGITPQSLESVLSLALAPEVDFADLYFQLSHHESWILEDGLIKEGTYDIEQGVGIRAISGEKSALAYSDEIYLPSLEEAARTAGCITQSKGQHKRLAIGARLIEPKALYTADNPLYTVPDQDKIHLLKQIDQAARAVDSRVKQVVVSLVGAHDTILVADSNGNFAADVRPLVRLNVSFALSLSCI